MSEEAVTRFPCFGGECAVIVAGRGPAGSAPDAAARAERRLRAWHAGFSRFEPDSELSRLNRDPRTRVPISAVMMRLLGAALRAARCSDGRVAPTLLPELRAAGYVTSFARRGLAPAPAAPAPAPPGERDERWREIRLDAGTRTVTRPPGLELDLGGIAKGVFGDILALALAGHETFAVDACGDLRLGGRAQAPRPVLVADPRGGPPLHAFDLCRGAAATSSVARRAWVGADGRPAHHLIDPRTGRPAATGIVQVTALAPDGETAEMRAKAALLAGAPHAAGWLLDGGIVVTDDGSVTVRAASSALTGAGEAVAA